MGMHLILVATAILSVSGIKVPVDNTDGNSSQTKNVDAGESSEPIYYESENDQLDSYLVPPNSRQPLDDLSADIATLATYLLPPSEHKQSDYYKPTEAGEQSDWYPIAPAESTLPRQLLPPRQAQTNQVSVPSRDLQPPLENAPNDYVVSVSEEPINVPLENERSPHAAGYPVTFWDDHAMSVPNIFRANSLAQFPYIAKKYKNPTKLYPKKYSGAFKPIPIPVSQTNEEIFVEIPKVKTFKQFKPNQDVDNEYRGISEDKKIQKFEEVQRKRISKRKPENIKVEEIKINESNEATLPEQDTSASNYREPLRQAYAAPLRQAPKPAATNSAQIHTPPADGDRTEFRMHGMKGPHSYQFGFDTGKGKNRQFRFEERDNNGRVKGHYGYMDKNGKLRVVNYDADPEHGFRADPPVVTE